MRMRFVDKTEERRGERGTYTRHDPNLGLIGRLSPWNYRQGGTGTTRFAVLKLQAGKYQLVANENLYEKSSN